MPDEIGRVHPTCLYPVDMRDGDTSKEAIGQRVVATRLALGFPNAAKFAETIGAQRNTLAMVESGKNRLNVDYAIAMRRQFGVSFDWLYWGDRSSLPLRIAEALPKETGDSAQRHSA